MTPSVCILHTLFCCAKALGGQRPPPWLSLWESWHGAAVTERVPCSNHGTFPKFAAAYALSVSLRSTAPPEWEPRAAAPPANPPPAPMLHLLTLHESPAKNGIKKYCSERGKFWEIVALRKRIWYINNCIVNYNLCCHPGRRGALPCGKGTGKWLDSRERLGNRRRLENGLQPLRFRV